MTSGLLNGALAFVGVAAGLAVGIPLLRHLLARNATADADIELNLNAGEFPAAAEDEPRITSIPATTPRLLADIPVSTVPVADLPPSPSDRHTAALPSVPADILPAIADDAGESQMSAIPVALAPEKHAPPGQEGDGAGILFDVPSVQEDETTALIRFARGLLRAKDFDSARKKLREARRSATATSEQHAEIDALLELLGDK